MQNMAALVFAMVFYLNVGGGGASAIVIERVEL